MAVTTAAGPVKSPPMTKRRAHTRARLIDAAVRVFADKGFVRVRVDDVCAAAGYTHGAFYSQFASLEELFYLIYEARADWIAEQVRASVPADPGEIVDRVVTGVLLDRDWLLIKYDFMLHAARNPEVGRRWAAHRAQMRVVFEESLIGARVELGEGVKDVSEAAQALISVYDGLGIAVLGDEEGDARATLTQFLGAVLR